MPTSLLKITQGATTDVPGRAVKGAIDGVTQVVWSNGDNTGVVNWKYELVYVPPGSAVPLATQNGATPTYTMPTPDKPGCYRMKLTTTDASGAEDVDIRNFGVAFLNSGIIAPPYQGKPPPLPLTGVGAKPDEMNFGGQANGWDGDAVTSRILLYQALQFLDASGEQLPVFATLVGSGGNQVLYNIPAGELPNGVHSIETNVVGRSAADSASYKKISLWRFTGGVAALVGAVADIYTPIESGGAAAWNHTMAVDGSGGINFLVTSTAALSTNWRLYWKIRRNV